MLQGQHLPARAAPSRSIITTNRNEEGNMSCGRLQNLETTPLYPKCSNIGAFLAACCISTHLVILIVFSASEKMSFTPSNTAPIKTTSVDVSTDVVLGLTISECNDEAMTVRTILPYTC